MNDVNDPVLIVDSLTLFIFWETSRIIAGEAGLDSWIGEAAGDHGLLDATIDELSLGLTSNSFTSENLVQVCD